MAFASHEILREKMRIFKKERLQNGIRHIYFMGVRIFSYSKGCHNTGVCTTWDCAHVISENVFTHDGYDDFEYDFLKHWFQNKRILGNYDVQVAWLIFISVAYDKKDYLIASNVFWHYYKRFGLSNIETYVPVCKLAASLGVKNELIEKTLAVESKVRNIRIEHRFENMIKNVKSIAIVGRSPILIGAGRGQEIDAHDVVIRFNMADVSGIYANDFGVKNDIMVINCWNKNDNSTFCLYKDFRTFGILPTVIDAIYNDDCTNADFLDFEIKKWCCCESGLTDPTSGAIIIMWVKKILGSLNKVDIYGFAFQDDNMNLGHYDGDYNINDNVHNMRAEIEYLRQLVKKG